MSAQGPLKGTSFSEVTEHFRQAILNQHNLIALAKRTAFEEDRDATETLILSIGTYNDAMFALYEKMNDMIASQVGA